MATQKNFNRNVGVFLFKNRLHLNYQSKPTEYKANQNS